MTQDVLSSKSTENVSHCQDQAHSSTANGFAFFTIACCQGGLKRFEIRKSGSDWLKMTDSYYLVHKSSRSFFDQMSTPSSAARYILVPCEESTCSGVKASPTECDANPVRIWFGVAPNGADRKEGDDSPIFPVFHRWLSEGLSGVSFRCSYVFSRQKRPVSRAPGHCFPSKLRICDGRKMAVPFCSGVLTQVNQVFAKDLALASKPDEYMAFCGIIWQTINTDEYPAKKTVNKVVNRCSFICP